MTSRGNVVEMKVYAIEHVQLAMPLSGEDSARSFYAGVLGLTEKPKPPHLAERGGVWFERGELKIHLGVESDFRPARKAHPALLVEGLDDQFDAVTKRIIDIGATESFNRFIPNDRSTRLFALPDVMEPV